MATGVDFVDMHVDQLRVLAETAHPSSTLEVRWIRRGETPDQVLRWLAPFDGWVEEREDRYHVDPPRPDLGVKIKDGVVLDLKGLRAAQGKLVIPGVGRGRLESWEKWTFPLHASAVPGPDASGWLALQKVRRRRSFHLVEGMLRERPALQATDPGCTIEVTDVTVDGESWWSLALEATGPAETLEQHLSATLPVLAADVLDPRLLDVRHSESYPAWLYGRVTSSRRSSAR